MTEKRKKEILGKIFYFLLCCFLGVITLLNLPADRISKEGKTLVRELSKDDLKYFSNPPNDRNIAWDQELPNFVYRDMQNAESSECNKIVYNFVGNQLTFNYESEQWKLEIMSIEDKNSDPDFPRKYTNFSIYHEKENLVIYATHFTNSFMRFVIGESGVYKEDVLTVDVNLPFDKEGFNTTIRVEDMTLLKEGEEFNFYLKGKKIASQKFEKLKNSSIKDAFILSDNGELYLLYYNSTKKDPFIEFVKVSSGVSLMKDEILMSRAARGGSNIPVFVKAGEEYVVVPESWDIYNNLKINSVNTDFPPIAKEYCNVTLENLEEKFIEAEFEYSKTEYDSEIGEWEIKKTYLLGDKEYYSVIEFNGYDDSIILPEEISKRYSGKKVLSIDEMWSTIEEIRGVYVDYYNHRGE